MSFRNLVTNRPQLRPSQVNPDSRSPGNRDSHSPGNPASHNLVNPDSRSWHKRRRRPKVAEHLRVVNSQRIRRRKMSL